MRRKTNPHAVDLPSAAMIGLSALSTAAAICSKSVAVPPIGSMRSTSACRAPTTLRRAIASASTLRTRASLETTSTCRKSASIRRSAKSLNVRILPNERGFSRAAALRCSRAAAITRSAEAISSLVSCRAAKASPGIPARTRSPRVPGSMSLPTKACVPALETCICVSLRACRSRASMYGERHTFPLQITKTLPSLFMLVTLSVADRAAARTTLVETAVLLPSGRCRRRTFGQPRLL